MSQQPMPLVVLISGGGSNLQALIDGMADGSLPITIRAVISNRADAGGLQRASAAGIATCVIDHRDHPDRDHYDAALQAAIDAWEPALVVLAGFMRILGAAFVDHYQGRMLNIHPSLLPRYRGLHTHARALEAGDREHGASVHFVTPALDSGPIIIQARVPIYADDDAERLAARVLVEEHRIYPQAVRWFAQGRLRLHHGCAELDGQPITNPLATATP